MSIKHVEIASIVLKRQKQVEWMVVLTFQQEYTNGESFQGAFGAEIFSIIYHSFCFYRIFVKIC